MPVDERVRRLVWSRAGGQCAFCGVQVVAESAVGVDASNVGEECHIVSSTPGGPRHDPSFPRRDIDDVTNLILLCRTHHRLVHERPVEYSSQALRLMKARHERGVERKLETLVGRKGQPALAKLSTGAEALAVVADADGFDFAHDPLAGAAEAELVEHFLKLLEKLGGQSLGPGRRVQAALQLTAELEALQRAGLIAYGVRLSRPAPSGAAKPMLAIAAVRVFRATNPIAWR
ncbi:MAG: HNH endonuclease [Elusimicrobia bacterium]|nr:HNH endonuclease [Elusimicrobiota bacterium]